MPDDSLPLYFYIILIVIIMVLNALVVASKRALDNIDRNMIKDLLEDKPEDRRLNAVTAFLSKPSKYHYADHAAQTINVLVCFFLLNTVIRIIYIKGGPDHVIVIPAIYICFFLLYSALAYILPKKLGAQTSESTGIGLIGFQRFVYYVTFPLVFISKGIADILLKISGKRTDVDDSNFSEDKVMSMLDRGQETGEIKEEGRKMIDSIFEFDDLLAYEIMTPRTDVFMIDLKDDRDEYFDEMMELTHSRIPVYDGDPDNIVGILHIKDYLYNGAKKGFDNINLKRLLRPAYFVPETKNIDSLFRELQNQKHHLAILIDEYGGFSGIVSVEDIIEQIVGDIDDEFDEEDRVVERVDDNTFIVDGNVYLDDLEEETGVELESETSETIGGFIIDHMGEIPKARVKYDPIVYGDYEFTILKVKDRRIEKVRIAVREKDEVSEDE
ncbi:MAG: HlyC/CorC family transporter [Mogibacterium sp.]|nr:HlyC/CorC family transporter [Mogibacterium sp.]